MSLPLTGHEPTDRVLRAYDAMREGQSTLAEFCVVLGPERNPRARGDWEQEHLDRTGKFPER